VLDNGLLIGIGYLDEIITIASRVFREPNIVKCVVVSEVCDGLVQVKCNDLVVLAPCDKSVRVGEEALLTIPSSRVVILKEPLHSKVKVFKARVVRVDAKRSEVLLSLNNTLLRARASKLPRIGDGESAYVYVKLPFKHLSPVTRRD